MLMADDSLNPISLYDFSELDDEFGPSIDIESFLNILREGPDPLQNSPEDSSQKNVQQGESTSDFDTTTYSRLQTELEEAPLFGDPRPGSVIFSPSYNSEASDFLLGGSARLSKPAGDSFSGYDFGMLEPSPPMNSPVHSLSGSFTDWMLPISGHCTLSVERDGATQNDSSCSRDDGKETRQETPNCGTPFTFAGGDARVLDPRVILDINCLKDETKLLYRGLEWDAHSEYASCNPLMTNSDMPYGKYCDLNANCLKISERPDLGEASIMGVDIALPDVHYAQTSTYIFPDILRESGEHYSAFPYCMNADDKTSTGPLRQYTPDSFNLEPTLDNYEMMVNGRDEVELLPTHNACSYSTVIFEANEGREGGTGSNAQIISNSGFRGLNVKCEDSKLISPTNENYSTKINDMSVVNKASTQPMPNALSKMSASKQSICMKDEKEEMFLSAKRVRHSLHKIDETASEKALVLPSTSIEKQLSHTKDEREIKPAQIKSVGSHLSKVVHQTSQSSVRYVDSLDDDSDVCILEDMSGPTPSNIYSSNGKSPVTSKRSTSDPLHHVGVGGVRLKTNDERLIFRAALQDLSQPKSEVSPPDGVLAVSLLRHQRIALSWMVQKETASLHCSGGILADDQGLGKTISTIALILKERSPSSRPSPIDTKQNEIETLNLDEDDDVSELDGPKQDSSISVQAKGRLAAGTLVVCPTSVLRQWADELQNKVTTKANLSVLVYYGGNRTKDPFELAKYDVVLTTYSIVSMEVPKQPLVDKEDDETVKRESQAVPPSKKRKYPPSSDKRSKKGMDSALLESVARPLARVGWFRVVLDEAQSIKNHKTQVARACWGLRAKRRWCLSGTPIQNAVDDLYSYFRFLRYDPYAVYKSFCSTIKIPINKNPTNGYRKLQAVLKTIMLRRTKGTLLDGEPIINLPPKSVELRKVDFTKEERDFYCRLEADSRAQFAEYAAAGTVKQNYVNILLMLLRLRQACDHPLLVRGYDSSSVWRSSVEMAKKLPKEKLVCLLNCLEASLAICGICNDPPEDAVVTNCGHVFCNQCICEHLTGDDNQCPTTNCKAQLSTSSVFSGPTLKSALSDQPGGQDGILSCSGSQLVERVDGPCPGDGCSFDSSKIRAALEVLQSLSKPRDCSLRTSPSKSIDESSSFRENSSDSPSRGSPREMNEDRNCYLDKYLNDSIKIVGDKAIVFSQWTKMLDLLEACLKNSSIQYRRLDGTMSVVARDKAVKDFNTLPEVSVMIMSLKAASLGLNMVAACHVLLLDLWWNPTTEDQAIDRAHRIGQTRPVTVLRLTVKDTVEDRILALQQKKREMVASAFGEDETGSRQTRLTVDDLKYLFMV